MPRLPQGALALAAGLLGAGLLGACGSQTKTVSVGGAPPASTTVTSSTGPRTTAPESAKHVPGTTPTSAASSTRTAPGPAFAQTEKSGADEAGTAAAVVRAHGYTPNDTSQYHGDQTLRVLVATRTGSGDGYGQQAFFFIDARYIGTDTREPSATVKVVSQSDTAVTLAYPLYRHGDPLCCPGGGQATVRFELDNGKLVPVGSIPPVSSASGLSRQ